MTVSIITGDCRERLRELPDDSVQCCVSSPPYFGLRDYGVDGQIGLEETPEAFVAELVAVFREVRRVLRPDGTLWLNLGDSYANDGKFGGATGGKHSKWLHGGETRIGREKRRTGLKPKDLIGIPWRVAFALQADGWYLRQDIVWAKPNPMPESVTDRCTKAHEYLFLLSKTDRYFFDAKAIAEPVSGDPESSRNRWDAKDYAVPGQKPQKRVSRSGNKARKPGLARGCPNGTGQNVCGSVPWEGSTRNKRSVWSVATSPFPDAHFATFPPALIEPCVLAGSRPGDTVLDPFGGAGTTGLVADRLGRDAVLIELNPEYAALTRRRIASDAGLFADITNHQSHQPETAE
ncbi:DNA-methyltransferase [Azospirillum brasilense]|uniref:DNA-methyltransferase n=1 Tax=Azospirillum brasilense TaxID=192 RepID=UPI000E68099B|nr:site-specific DNA-methyltransferase [Azospirillum brasilense]NUB25757.1 site-specific DNA-methyltransferase [Azospirillum brasilense]NUB33895.1 site-specific DNA-methyltransferase [Azospirillum brasilense]RIW07733.1 site-specific DNA-methyltransferase [Azospirillum brasilense]